jgi:hypothetical protein
MPLNRVRNTARLTIKRLLGDALHRIGGGEDDASRSVAGLHATGLSGPERAGCRRRSLEAPGAIPEQVRASPVCWELPGTVSVLQVEIPGHNFPSTNS